MVPPWRSKLPPVMSQDLDIEPSTAGLGDAGMQYEYASKQGRVTPGHAPGQAHAASGPSVHAQGPGPGVKPGTTSTTHAQRTREGPVRKRSEV